MITVYFQPGEHIDSAADRLVQEAQRHGAAKGAFNEIELRADRSTKAAAISAFYTAESARRAEAYRNSPEGRAAEAKSAAERADLQARHDALMRRLPTLNMQDDVAVLEWLCAMQEPSDRTGVIVRRDTIVSAFEAAGFCANECTGADYRAGDRVCAFRYLVGQALAGLKEGPAIHPIIHKFASDWRRRFISDAQKV